MALEGLNNLEWLEPWFEADYVCGLESELGRGVSVNHPLLGVKATAVARGDGDDVLFYLSGYSPSLAVVHLTWHKESSSDFPCVLFYYSLEEFVEKRMNLDHKEYLEMIGEAE